MIGGWVIESALFEDQFKDKWRVWCVDRNGDERAIFMSRAHGSMIRPLDQIWWQGTTVYWTPRDPPGHMSKTVDIPLSRIGYAFDPRRRRRQASS
jgi:hypothetical protein